MTKQINLGDRALRQRFDSPRRLWAVGVLTHADSTRLDRQPSPKCGTFPGFCLTELSMIDETVVVEGKT